MNYTKKINERMGKGTTDTPCLYVGRAICCRQKAEYATAQLGRPALASAKKRLFFDFVKIRICACAFVRVLAGSTFAPARP